MKRTLAVVCLVSVVVLGVFHWRRSGDRARSEPTPSTPGARDGGVRKAAGPEEEGGAVGVEIWGQFRDQLRPLVGAEVLMVRPERVSRSTDEGARIAAEVKGVTDDDGKCRFEALATGDWMLLARAKGYRSVRERFQLRKNDSWSKRLELRAHAGMRGVVRSKDGGAVGGCIVQLRIPPQARLRGFEIHPNDYRRERALATLTDESGGFLMDVVPSDARIEALFDHKDYGRRILQMEPLQPGELRELDVVLEVPAIIIGRVEPGPEEQPDCNVTCWQIVGNTASMLGEERLIVGKENSFEVRGVAPGRKLLAYRRRLPGRLLLGYTEVEAVSERTVDAGLIPVIGSRLIVEFESEDLAEPRAVWLNGRIIVTQDTEAMLYRAHPWDVYVSSASTLEVNGLHAGTLQLAASVRTGDGKDNDPAFETANVEVPFDGIFKRVVVRLYEKTHHDVRTPVSIVVAPPEDVRVDELDARVVLLREGVVLKASGRSARGVSRFTLGSFVPGEYEIRVAANGHVANPVHIQLRAGETATAEIGHWRESGALLGRVIDMHDRPVEGAVVMLVRTTHERESEWPLVEEKTDAEGRFNINAVFRFSDMKLVVLDGAARSDPIPVQWSATVQKLAIRIATPEDHR